MPLLRIGAALTLVCACLPEDDLASYSRAWTSEPEALLPAPTGDGGVLPPSLSSDAGELPSPPSASPGEPSPAADDAGARAADAGEPLDAGPDAAGGVVDAGSPASEQTSPLADGGSVADAAL
jgi:hypothetical protein